MNLSFKSALDEVQTIHADTRQMLMWAVAQHASQIVKMSGGCAEPAWQYVEELVQHCFTNRVGEDLQVDLQQTVAAAADLDFVAVEERWVELWGAYERSRKKGGK